MEKLKEEKNISLKFANIKLNRIKLLLAVFSFALLFTAEVKSAEAASLYLSPSSGLYGLSDNFSVSVLVSSEGQAINAVSGSISFPQDRLEITAISKSGSIINLWVAEPSFSNSAGTVSFEGIVLNPGFTGRGGKIITITFKAKSAGDFSLIFSSGSILANDGTGTNVLAGMDDGSYKISDKVQPEEIKKDESTPQEEAPAAEETTKKTAEIISAATARPQISSATHPDQDAWYINNKVKFKWELPPEITGVSISLNNKPISNPGPLSDGLFYSREYGDLIDGIYYLHLKFKSNGYWSAIDRFKVQIDTTPPQPFKISVDAKEGIDWPVLSSKTTDLTSGIDRYEVKLGGKDIIIKAEEISLKVPVLPPGEYTAIVKAVDKAGNEVASVADFIIQPIETPIIITYPEDLRSSDRLFISGTSLPEVTVNLFIQSKKTGEIVKISARSDEMGDWYIVYHDKIKNGRYFAWVEAINSKRMKSESSNKISFLVTPPIFTRLGPLVISYFTAFVILTLFIIIVVFFLAYWVNLMRNRLKKETNEAYYTLHKNLRNFKTQLERDMDIFIKLKRKAGNEKEKQKLKKSLKQKIDFIENKITKEINDINELLK
jgi:hypothetical protein